MERVNFVARNFYSLFLPDFFAAAQRAFIAAAIRLRAAGDIPRRFLTGAEVDRLVVPGGRPRRLPETPSLTLSKACIAASSLSRSARKLPNDLIGIHSSILPVCWWTFLSFTSHCFCVPESAKIRKMPSSE